MKEHIHSRIAKILVVLALAVVASVMFVFVGCSSECEHANTHVESTATCTKDGVDKTICDDCGATIKTTEHKAEGHDWDEGKVVAATCTAGGYTLQTCSRCNAQRQVEQTDALGHEYEVTNTVASTCTVAGSQTYKCANCGDTYTVALPLAEHTYGERETIVEATCTTNGYSALVCEVCGRESEVLTIEKTGHTYSTVADPELSVAPTCESDGRNVYVCEDCGEERIIPVSALGHDWVLDEDSSVAATCATEGVNNYTCSRCPETKQEKTAATGEHTYVTTTFEPTCETQGYDSHTCSVCGNTYVNNVVPNKNHHYVRVVVEATCTTDGVVYNECEYCRVRYVDPSSEGVKALGHDYVWTVTAAATCTTDGTIVGVCQREGCTEATAEHRVEYTGTTFAAKYPNFKTDTELQTAIGADVIAANGGVESFLKATGHAYYSAQMGKVFTDADIEEDKTIDDYYQFCVAIGKVTINDKEYDYSDYSLVCTNEGCTLREEVKDHVHADDEYDCLDTDGDGIAWTCDECGYKQLVKAHNYILMHQDEAGEWVASDADAQFDCLNPLVCEYCHTVYRTAPHVQPSATDPTQAAYMENCQHGRLCVVCEKAVFGVGPTNHQLTKALTDDESITIPATTEEGEATIVKNVAATCTTAKKVVTVCPVCYEIAQQDASKITWANEGQNPNYKIEDSGDPLGHDWVAETCYGEGTPGYCTTASWKVDTCSRCDITRVEKDTPTASTRPATDDAGKYDVVEAKDDHNYVLALDIDYENTPGMERYQAIDCEHEAGFMVWVCATEGCTFSEWRTVTTQEYAEAKYPELSAEAALAALKASEEYHVGNMPVCGHPICDVCEADEIDYHRPQYILNFVMTPDASIPTGAAIEELGSFTGWMCYTINTNYPRLDAYIKAHTNTTLYTYAFYDGDTAINSWVPYLTQFDEQGDAYIGEIEITCKVSLNEGIKDNDNYNDPTNIFYTGYPTTIKWINDNITDQRSQYLDIELCIDTDVIKPEEVESLSITLKNGSGDDAATVATAVCNTEAQLAAFVNSCNTIWGKAEGNKQWIQIEEFCSKVSEEAYLNLDGSFMVTNTLEYKTCLDGYVLEIELVAGGVTFERTITIADTQEYLYATPDATSPVLVDVPAASTGDTVSNAD